MMAVWAVYDVLAGVLVGNIAFYELLRKLVSPRKNEGGMVCCGRGLLLWLAPLIFSSGPGCPEHPTQPTGNHPTHLLPIGHQLVQQLVVGGAYDQDAREGFACCRDAYFPIVLAVILAVNVAYYELLRKLASNRKKAGRTICRRLRWVLWPARAAGKNAIYVVLRPAGRIVVNAATCFNATIYHMRKGTRRTINVVLWAGARHGARRRWSAGFPPLAEILWS